MKHYPCMSQKIYKGKLFYAGLQSNKTVEHAKSEPIVARLNLTHFLHLLIS